MVKTYRKRAVHLALFIASLLFILTAWPAATSSSVQPLSPIAPQTRSNNDAPTLRSLAQQRNFSIGTALDFAALQNEPPYRQALAEQFNMVTAEDSMKFDHTEPQPGVYTFAQGDAIVAFAHAHGITVRGHNLVWYRALPAWVANGTFTRDQLINILRDHIMTEVSHYRGQVNIWDVVNEAIDDNGNLRDSIWLRVIGPDYIDMAFRWAHEANPQALLFYNDYGGEGLSHKSDAIYALVQGLVARGVPINGVGLQMHVALNRYPSSRDLLANMQRLAALGLQVQITEMDVSMQGDPRPMQQKLQAQASIYSQALSTCLSFAPCTAFVMWGFTDAYSWIPAATGHPDYPLIFDASYHPKPAYYALLGVLRTPP
jgi:endo-1,4-beta-xylanase